MDYTLPPFLFHSSELQSCIQARKKGWLSRLRTFIRDALHSLGQGLQITGLVVLAPTFGLMTVSAVLAIASVAAALVVIVAGWADGAAVGPTVAFCFSGVKLAKVLSYVWVLGLGLATLLCMTGECLSGDRALIKSEN